MPVTPISATAGGATVSATDGGVKARATVRGTGTEDSARPLPPLGMHACSDRFPRLVNYS